MSHVYAQSALGDVLHRLEPAAVSELRHPETRTLRLGLLLNEAAEPPAAAPPAAAAGQVAFDAVSSGPAAGGPGGESSVGSPLGATDAEAAGTGAGSRGEGGEAEADQLQQQQQEPQQHQQAAVAAPTGASAGAAAAGEGVAAAGAASGAVAGGGAGALAGGGPNPGLLRVVKGQRDIVVVLDIQRLLQRAGLLLQVDGGRPGDRQQQQQQQQQPPLSPGGVLRRPGEGSAGLGDFAAGGTGAAVPVLQGAVAGAPADGGVQGAVGGALQWHGLAPSDAAVADVADSISGFMLAGALGSYGQQQIGTAGGGPGDAFALQHPSPAASGAAGSVGGAGPVEGISDAALRAFPGAAPAARLRRALVGHLGSLPRRGASWQQLTAFLASGKASTAWHASLPGGCVLVAGWLPHCCT